MHFKVSISMILMGIYNIVSQLMLASGFALIRGVDPATLFRCNGILIVPALISLFKYYYYCMHYNMVLLLYYCV